MRKNIIKTFAIMATLISLVACSSSSTRRYAGVKQLRNPEGLSHAVNDADYASLEYLAFKQKMGAFSAKLSEAIAKREYKDGDNYVTSPLSIELCLGLAIRCANGNTREELLNVMDMDYESFNANYRLFYDSLNKQIKNNMDKLTSQLLLTNSIWIDDEVALKDEGLDALRDDYYCYSNHADFNNENKAANDAIKNFIKEKTKGLINQDLGLSTETLFVLMNTLYLKDIWNEEGDDLSYAPSEYKFKNSDGSFSSAKLLSGYYNLGRTISFDDYSCFYTKTHSGYRLYFIKPNEGKNLKDIFNEETIKYINDSAHYVIQDDEKLERYHTNCYFPEFDVKGDVDLKPIFQEDFNVKTLFNNGCDLSNISNDNVYCSDFKNISRLKVDKSGIEGAAVTYMAYAGAVGPDEYKDVYETFVVDKEFGFVLTTSENIVFSGMVTNIK